MVRYFRRFGRKTEVSRNQKVQLPKIYLFFTLLSCASASSRVGLANQVLFKANAFLIAVIRGTYFVINFTLK